MLILDSSVTLAWFVPDESSGATQKLLDRVVEHGAVVPQHWQIEVGNALLMAIRRRRIPARIRDEALAQLLRMQIEIDAETLSQAWHSSMGLADAYGLTLYDACYLELAQRRGLPLASLDKKLRTAGRKLGLSLL